MEEDEAIEEDGGLTEVLFLLDKTQDILLAFFYLFSPTDILTYLLPIFRDPTTIRYNCTHFSNLC